MHGFTERNSGGLLRTFIFGSLLGIIFFVIAIAVKLGILAAIGFIIYFFIAAAGLVPPLDYIPLIPYI
jgi:hypothetical protein